MSLLYFLQMFHDTAYSAVCEDDIMDAIDNFLDDSIVLPPGDWDQELLLPVMQERNKLRRRKGEEELNSNIKIYSNWSLLDLVLWVSKLS